MTRAARRFPIGMSLFTLVILILLIGLGVWQLQRRVEKHALIAALTERLSAAPVPLPPPSQWTTLTPGHDEFRRVTFAGALAALPDANVFTSGSALRTDVTTLGTFVFAPVDVDGQRVVVDRGFAPDGAVAPPPPSGAVTMVGYIRFPEKGNWLTPAPDPGKRLWFARDHLGMARALGWGNVAPFYIDLESPSPASGLPKPGPLQVHLKDDHMQYAITWFALAGALVIAFAAWLRSQLRRPGGS
jgi:cytochrome oxidase assembly protein ShyY1